MHAARPPRTRTSSKPVSSTSSLVQVVQAVDFVSDDPAHAGAMTMTWEATAVDAGTRVDIRADDVPAGISAKDHAMDSPLHWPNLATYLEQ